VFPSKTGCRRCPSQHLQRGGKANGFREALVAVGITRPVRQHDLRHTCASSLIAGWWGTPWRLEEVREVLGHTSSRITERYAHLASAVVADKAALTLGLQGSGLGYGVGYDARGPVLALPEISRANRAPEGAATHGSC
jgi:integrase